MSDRATWEARFKFAVEMLGLSRRERRQLGFKRTRAEYQRLADISARWLLENKP